MSTSAPERQCTRETEAKDTGTWRVAGWTKSTVTFSVKNRGCGISDGLPDETLNRPMADSRAEGQRQGMLEKKRKKMIEEFEKQKEQISKV